MKKLLDSKIAAWFAMLLASAIVVISCILRTPWWGLIAEFFCFMGVFSHLAALYLAKMSVSASGKLDRCALVLLILAGVAFIVEYFLFNT